MGNYVPVKLFLLSAIAASANALTSTELGMMMAVRAYGLVCFYEKLKQFPDTDAEGYTRDCFGKAEYVKNHITDDEMGRLYFGDWLKKIAMDGLPSDYRHSCSDYLSDPDRAASVNEGDALNDGQTEPYPFQGLAYCLMNTLRNKFGSQAIETVKSEKTHKLKHWISTLLDRQNEFRARHGAEPLQLVQELTQSAQQWADKIARDCKLQGSRYSDPQRRFNGNSTGESLSAGPSMPSEDTAYLAADSWYEEVKEYPFDFGYRGNGLDSTFGKISNFAQTVWKDTKFVGYGLSVNKDCPNFQTYVVARYSPPGNYIGKFQSNVGPPKSYYYARYYYKT